MATNVPAWFDELTVADEAPWLAMGIRALHESRRPFGFERPDASELRERKLGLLNSARDDVCVAVDGVDAAVEEAAQLVADVAGQRLGAGRSPLEAAALLVSDDLVVLVRRTDSWIMAAGVVCFPSHWSPPTKLGRSIAEVHAPVPQYDEALRERVDRFLHRLRPGRVMWRRNWTIHESVELHAPRAAVLPAPVAVGEHWLRSERQTLTALPKSGGILFTIDTEQVPLDVLVGHRDLSTRIAMALRATPPELARYRFGAIDPLRVATWLDTSIATTTEGRSS